MKFAPFLVLQHLLSLMSKTSLMMHYVTDPQQQYADFVNCDKTILVHII